MTSAKSQLLKALLALTAAILLMLLVRATIVTVCSVEGDALEPTFLAGDRVLVSRWSYGLRVGGSKLLSNNRLCRKSVDRGDILAVNDPTDSLQSDVSARRVLLVRCEAVPGEASPNPSERRGLPTDFVVPGRINCADQDYYVMEPVGTPRSQGDRAGLLLVPEDHIIGRAYLIIYSHEPGASLFDGWRSDRFLCYP